MGDTTIDDEDLVRLAIGGRATRRRRLSRRQLARMLGQDYEAEDEGEEGLGEEDTDQERRLERLLIGSRMLRRPRLRRLLVAHLLRERAGGEDEDIEGEEDMGAEEGGDKERRLVRLLVGSRMLKRRRVRRALLGHLLRERSEAEDEDVDDEEDIEAEGSGEKERKLVRLLIASRMLQRRRVRRALVAHLLRERGEAEDEDEEVEGEEDIGGENGGERDIGRLLVGGRMLKRRRARRALMAHLLRERRETEEA